MSAEKIDDEFHRVRELALHGKTIPKGDGYQVRGAAAAAAVPRDRTARERKSEYQKLYSRFDKLSNLFDQMWQNGGGEGLDTRKPKPKPK